MRTLLDALAEPGRQELARQLVRGQFDIPIPDQTGNSDPHLQNRLQARLDNILATIDASEPVIIEHPARKSRHWGWWAAAVVVLGAGYWYFNQSQPRTASPELVQGQTDLQPGRNAAVLTLSSGEQIPLDSNASGMLSTQGNTAVINSGGQLSYQTQQPSGMLVYNTLTTAKGNQYRLILPDGTKAWLNAATAIKYPVAFTGHQRLVEVSGEVYFEVVHNDKQPFIVKAGGQIIEDMGTAFNVNAYPEDNTVKTTLTEGALKIGATILKPGQQAIAGNGQLKVSRVDTSQVLAWKNGLFSFRHTPLEEVMKQLSRWYDVEVVYAGEMPEMFFGGKISRNTKASVVLTILQKSGIFFKIQDRKIIVTKQPDQQLITE